MSLNSIKPAQSIPDDVNVVIEIPAQGGDIKYEIDKDSGLLAVDRFMPTSMQYPCNYGFIPNTLADDGDPVDVLVITPTPVQPGSLMRVRILGMLNMTDEAGHDCKLLALPIKKHCMMYSHLESMNDIAPTLLDSIKHFFENYKGLEDGKWVKVDGWEGVEAASKIIEDSLKG